jgi:hypothetical protein
LSTTGRPVQLEELTAQRAVVNMRYLATDIPKKISKIGLGTSQFGSADWGYGRDYAS